MPIVTVRVDEELKKKMDEHKEVNWSEVTRRAIEEKISEYELWQRVNIQLLREAASETDSLRRKIEGWNSIAEIRRWRSLASGG